MSKFKTEEINCPYCKDSKYKKWGTENKFTAVKCLGCGLVYVNPRPIMSSIDEAVRTGSHSEEANSINVVTKRISAKTKLYKNIFKEIYNDIWSANKKISWLDVGAGFGEIIEALKELASKDSIIEGLEPMYPKAKEARNRGLTIHEKYLNQINNKYDFISLINVFSHIPDFHAFLKDAKNVLNERGEIFIETGNAADMDRDEFSGVLSLPDHLVFSGESQIIGFLEKAGFEVLEIRKERVDTITESIKDIGRYITGQPVLLKFPYTSPYRTMFVRARLKEA